MKRYDAIIVGAGLSGLFCALHLQKKGLNVLVIEKKLRAGGLCGTELIDGYEFLVGCYDFGSLLKKELEYFNISVEFYKPKTIFYVGDKIFSFPLTMSTAIKIMPYTVDIIRLLRAIKKGNYKYYGELVDHSIKNPEFLHLLKSFAYVFACSPNELSLSAMSSMFKKEYGNAKMISPLSGPQIMIDKICNKFNELGGTILLDTEYLNFNSESSTKQVLTSKGTFESKYLVSSNCTIKNDENKSGLELSFLLLAVDKKYNYPKGISTISYFPSSNHPDWMTLIDKGEKPDEFGFHIANAKLPDQKDYFTLNVLFYLPRGKEKIHSDEAKSIEDFLLNKISHFLPNINQSIRYKRLLSPQDYQKIHGLSCRPNPFVLKSGSIKPRGYDAINDIYFIGNHVLPEGEQAGAAIMSGKIAAEDILSRLKRTE